MKPEYDKNPRSIHNISYSNKPSISPDVVDTAQRGVKITAIVGLLHQTLEHLDGGSVWEAIANQADATFTHKYALFATLIACGFIVAYKIALEQVRRGNHSKVCKWIVKLFGSAKKWEAEADPIMKDLFNV